MRLGITLPTFSDDATGVLETARRAEAAGIDGLFAFDHLWPLGHPERPALESFLALGAAASVTSRTALGTLVARVGLRPDEVLAAGLESLASISGGRAIAGLGLGDRSSQAELDRNGIARSGIEDRRSRLLALVGRLVREGIDCWAGVGDDATREAAARAGAAIVCWEATPDELAAVRLRHGCAVCFGGPIRGDAQACATQLAALAAAGAEWAVWGWPSSIELVAESASLAGLT